MNTAEGFRRIGTAIRWIGDGIGVGCVLVGAGNAVNDMNVDFFVFGLIGAALFVGAGRLVSWIIIGFAEPPKRE